MLDKKYNHKDKEKFWQNYWRENEIYKFQDDLDKSETFVIDTPPPTVSGLLHMGHVFSYCQVDFIARFQRMNGKDVFYPMGFDDNGLPTERLVEKVKKIRAVQMDREDFIKECESVVKEAEEQFEALFSSVALSVDWNEKYQTISNKSQTLSQSSFVDLYQKGLVYRDYKPVIWDIADQTALSQADLEDLEASSKANFINFESEDGDKIEIMTTRPELLPACVALLLNPNHYYAKKINATKEGRVNKFAYSTACGVKVPIIIDNDVKIDDDNQSNITGAVMCCTFGDENDVKWTQKYNLTVRQVISDYGKMYNKTLVRFLGRDEYVGYNNFNIKELSNSTEKISNIAISNISKSDNGPEKIYLEDIEDKSSVLLQVDSFKDNISIVNFVKLYNEIFANKKIKQAREDIIEFLTQQNLLTRPSKEIKQVKRIAERSKSEIEYVLKEQWYIKILPFKNELEKQITKCNWYPDFMKIRALQWCENLNSDWCISRQRFFGVPIPAWKIEESNEVIVAEFTDLPIDPKNVKKEEIEKFLDQKGYKLIDFSKNGKIIAKDSSGSELTIIPETDILDTWATSSISPQLSSGLVSEEMLEKLKDSKLILEGELNEKLRRHNKLFPADLRPQAHEIIRSWAFYTIVKAYLHNLDKDGKPKKGQENLIDKSIPWKNLMISGWCLAGDKTKMSKSKGNVITPTTLIEEKGSDAVRYWTSTSNLGSDTAYSDTVFKIGQKLTTKLFNASKFAAINFELIGDIDENSAHDKITEISDLWILSKLRKTILLATKDFEKFEYAKAREKIEDFFWNDFCDNYLEIVKVRSYGLEAQKLENQNFSDTQKEEIKSKQISAILTLKISLNKLLKLFSPFIPHICEEIYSKLFENEFRKTKSICARGNWPKINKDFENELCEEIGEEMLKVISRVRKYKSDNSLSMKTTISHLTIVSKLDIKRSKEDLENVCGANNIEFQKGEFSAVIKID